jgi:hypothetical protein
VVLLGVALFVGRRFARRALRKAMTLAHEAGAAPSPSPPKTPVTREHGPVVMEVFSGGLKSEWVDYGWTDREVKGPGPARLKFGDFGGWILYHPPPAVPGTFGAVVFKMKAPKEHGEFLEVKLDSSGTSAFEAVRVTPAHVAPLADGWVEVVVQMHDLNPYAIEFDRLRLRAYRKVPGDWVLVDGIAFTAPSKNAPPPRTFPSTDAAMVVRCAAPTHPISPLIYGVAATKDEPEMFASARRMGGNGSTRYNWELGDAWNTAADWYFQNVKLDWTYRTFIETGLARKNYLTITVPIMGWVAKDRSSYSFPVSAFGAQKEVDPSHADIGNGVGPDGKELKPGDPGRTSIPAPPEMIRRWVEAIRKEDAQRGARSVRSYILDNEPGLWNSTHRDVHPDPLTYDELLDRTIRYGSAVRAADPEAVIAGPAEWGWSNYFWSSKDIAAGVSARPDRRAHGDTPLLAWYLAKLREHEQKTGVRILDVVDLHFYPQGKGLYQGNGGGATDPESAERRIRATRALWDPSYVDESWIKEAVRLIPRLKEMIAENYPGRGMSIGEWNFGAEGHMSGGLALAEALGRFAQGGVTSAYYWVTPKKNTPAYWAFRAYRNVDGKGSGFLDQYVESSAPEGTSLFVSRNEAGTRLVAIALNFKNDEGKKAKIDVSACGKVTSRKTYTFSGDPRGFGEPKVATGEGGAVQETLPPYSITVLDLDLAPAPKP